MAKKHSSKTATQEAIKSAEPRILSFKGWQGVNYADAPLTWEPLEIGPGKDRQTDLPSNYLMVQNNLITTDTRGLETRPDSRIIGEPPTITIGTSTFETEFTGIATVIRRLLFCAVRIKNFSPTTEVVVYRDLTVSGTSSWNIIRLINGEVFSHYGSSIDTFIENNFTSSIRINEIAQFAQYLIVTGVYNNELDSGDVPCMLVAKATFGVSPFSITVKGYFPRDNQWTLTNYVCGVPKVPNPTTANFSLQAVKMKSATVDGDEDAPTRIQICHVYTTIFGSTLAGPSVSNVKYKTIYVEYDPQLWNKKRYLHIQCDDKYYPDESSVYIIDENITRDSPINGVDLYARINENTEWFFIGHVSKFTQVIPNSDDSEYYYRWEYKWFGAMTDTKKWLNSSMTIPEENNTASPGVSHVACVDSRLYYWGVKGKQYRLYIGGNPGNELSISRGLGGAYIDIEAGSGYLIRGVTKWKTQSGANITTIMCWHQNTSKVKRFNLIETNLSLSNEVQYKSYMYEEVSNVTGCNSRWGYGVFEDGLYSVNRYGLMLVTMASEYNSQMKSQKVSGVIDPIFTERIGNRLNDSRMIYIDGIIYIALSETEGHSSSATSLDNVLLCYDIEKKAWYTFTHDEMLSSPDTDHILGIISVDSDDSQEGLGAITKNQVRLYPTTGIQNATVPAFQVIMETGELIPKMPKQAFYYIQQLEFRFDYFIGNPNNPATILIEGVDYYGRSFSIEKQLNIKSRGNHGLTGEQRAYIEWIRVDKIVESMRIRIKGKARFRLTHINARCYQQSDTIGTPYGFDSLDSYKDRHGNDHVIHHYIKDYNNLRKAVIA